MSRRRFVRPSFWESAAATSISAGSRLLLIGLWTLADDEGILRWDPATVKELIFPADREVTYEHVESWMNELTKKRVAVRYRGPDRLWYGYLVGFERDHRPERPKPSKLPAPPLTGRSATHAYLLRDGGRCHLCGGPVIWSGSDKVAVHEGHDLSETVEVIAGRGGSSHPSGVAVAHVACALVRAGRPVNEAQADEAIVALGSLSRAVADGSGARAGVASGPVETVSEVREQGVFGVASGGAEVPAKAVSGPVFDSAGLSESDTVGLTEGSVSPTVSSSADEPALSSEAAETGALTCENVESGTTHDILTESVVSLHGGLTAKSRTEREMEGKGKWKGTKPLSAPRSCSDEPSSETNPAEATPQQPTASAFGAGNEEAATTRTDQSVLSSADASLDDTTTRTSNETGDEPVTIDESQESLFAVPAEMVREPEPVKKRKSPASWTEERKEAAHSILRPWWANYGDGWTQSYGVVFGVIVSVLANNVPLEDVARALDVLGPERKPISGGTIGFALSKTTKQVAEATAFEAAASSRSADKYTQRTM